MSKDFDNRSTQPRSLRAYEEAWLREKLRYIADRLGQLSHEVLGLANNTSTPLDQLVREASHAVSASVADLGFDYLAYAAGELRAFHAMMETTWREDGSAQADSDPPASP